MDASLPDYIYPLELAKAGATIAGVWDAGRLSRQSHRQSPRLSHAGIVVDREVRLSLRFSQDREAGTCVTGTIDAGLQMLCQRCMGPLTLDIQAEVALIVVTSTQQASDLPEPWDPLFSSASRVALGALIEDELLLAVPMIACHADGECTAYQHSDGDRSEPADNPFACLAHWKTGNER